MHTLKAEKNSSVRQTTILEGEEGRFRFVIRVSKNLMWGSVNGVMVHLTFDEGWQVNQYPIAIFKPGADIGDLVPTPGIWYLTGFRAGVEVRIRSRIHRTAEEDD